MYKYKNKYKLIAIDEKQSKSLSNYMIKRRKKIITTIILPLIIVFIIFLIFLLKNKNKNRIKLNFIKNNSSFFDVEIYNKSLLKLNRTLYEELTDCQKFVDKAVNHSLINPNEKFTKSENPKISVVIPIYNAEGYIENAICAIENQDLKDIEIIIIDDNSLDNSVQLVKNLMEKDPRIFLYKNKETKGTLYSKSKGVSLSKGKYVLVSDQDDLYTQEDAFSSMFYEIEKNNLDILGFATIFVPTIDLFNKPALYIFQNTPIYHQPYISQRMYYFKGNRTVIRSGDVIWNYIFRTEVFQEALKQIDDKIMNTRMNCHEDFLLFFLLTRKANSLKNIKRIFYAHIYWVNSTQSNILFSKSIKENVKKNYKCLSYINYIEFLLDKTNNDENDKIIASFELQNWFLNHNCKNNSFIKERAIKVCKSFLENPYINKDIKDKILLFLNSENK